MFRAKSKHSTARRLTLVTAATATALLVTAGPASAHVEVESDKAQALAENVEISFDAESESDTAGITKIRVVLPEGIAPADVAYGEGPKDWKFTAAEDGYTVQGPAVKAGRQRRVLRRRQAAPGRQGAGIQDAADLQRRPHRPLDRTAGERREPGAGPEVEGRSARCEADQPVAK